MKNMDYPNKIRLFLKSLNKNAPLSSSGKTLNDIDINGYKYPYKPILILSICNNINDMDKLFNCKIYINEKSPITKTYYDYLMNSEIMYEYLKTHKSKEEWHLIFNNKVAKQVVFNIFDQPAKQLNAQDFWFYNKVEGWVMFSFDGSNEEKKKLRDLLINKSYIVLKKCIPDFKNLSEKEFEVYDQFWYQLMLNGTDSNLEQKCKTRKYQHIFRKMIFQRDYKCKICCLEKPELLEAAHIKPYSHCDNDIDRYSINNGILLCKNHHALFEHGYFTFTNEWKVKISNELINNYKPDYDLLFKTFERCYEKELSYYPNSNIYTNYHNKNIYKN